MQIFGLLVGGSSPIRPYPRPDAKSLPEAMLPEEDPTYQAAKGSFKNIRGPECRPQNSRVGVVRTP